MWRNTAVGRFEQLLKFIFLINDILTASLLTADHCQQYSSPLLTADNCQQSSSPLLTAPLLTINFTNPYWPLFYMYCQRNCLNTRWEILQNKEVRFKFFTIFKYYAYTILLFVQLRDF